MAISGPFTITYHGKIADARSEDEFSRDLDSDRKALERNRNGVSKADIDLAISQRRDAYNAVHPPVQVDLILSSEGDNLLIKEQVQGKQGTLLDGTLLFNGTLWYYFVGKKDQGIFVENYPDIGGVGFLSNVPLFAEKLPGIQFLKEMDFAEGVETKCDVMLRGGEGSPDSPFQYTSGTVTARAKKSALDAVRITVGPRDDL